MKERDLSLGRLSRPNIGDLRHRRRITRVLTEYKCRRVVYRDARGQLPRCGDALNALVGLPLDVGIVGFGVLVITYTTLGGFQDVVWTDTL